MKRAPITLPPVLPVGTHVVTRVALHTPAGAVTRPAGAVGVVVRMPADPQHAYRVRFPDGAELSLTRADFSVRKQHKSADLAPAERDWTPYIQYACVVGSRAFGLDTEGSDTDRRGFYLPPARDHWGLAGVPEQLEFGEECYWEVQKFVTLALKANPNVLECLYTSLVERATPIAQELLALREAFLSKLVYQTYNGYVLSQFKKLESDLRQHGEIRWKHAMHLIRLLHSGIAVLERAEVQVHVGAARDDLLAVKRGELPWDELNRWRLDLHARFDRAYGASRLPERPDFGRINAYLLRARQHALELE